VEDEAAVRELMRDSLEGYGYKVLEAGDIECAVDTCRGHDEPIHLLVTDMVLPGASGREVAEQLTRLRPSLKVLFTSGYTEDAIALHRQADREAFFLQKPYGLTALASKVREVLDR
jgi:CheY-like chemotaxis protein